MVGVRVDLEAGHTYVQPRGWTGPPPALAPHGLFSTDDPPTAERLGSPFLGRHRIKASIGAADRFRASLHTVTTGPVTLAYLDLASATQLDLSGSAPRFLVVEPMHGAAHVTCDDASFDATPDCALVLQPGRAITLLWPAGAGCLLVGIEQEALVVHLSRLLGRAPDRTLSFLPSFDLAAPASARWNLAVEVLQAELAEHRSLLRRGVGNGQLEEFLMSGLLFGHQSTYSDLLTRPPSGTERRTTTVAKQFIDVNLSERLTSAAVAAAAGVSVRTLEASFRSDLHTTPSAFIRSRRLDRARADLLSAAGTDADRVTDVATRWGISHLGRFAAEYKARFGETPSETLRRPIR